MPEEELKSIRMSEARAAARTLGVGESDLVFMEIENGKLKEKREVALQKIMEVIDNLGPGEVFIPYNRCSHSEHVLTNQIVLEALRKSGTKAVVYEYPIWFWDHWPWVSIPEPGLRRAPRFLAKSAIHSTFLLRDFGCRVPTEGVLDLKREALECYKTQVTRYIPDDGWWNLPSLSGGQFLECFFQRYEIFKRFDFDPRK